MYSLSIIVNSNPWSLSLVSSIVESSSQSVAAAAAAAGVYCVSMGLSALGLSSLVEKLLDEN